MSGDDPSDGARAPTTQFGSLDDARGRYQAAWVAGERPRIEAYLVGAAGADRGALLRDLLTVELDLRRRCGEWPLMGDYLARFPNDADLVESVFLLTCAEGERPPDTAGAARTTVSLAAVGPAEEPTEPAPDGEVGDGRSAPIDSGQTTAEWSGRGRAVEEPAPLPERINRYVVLALLGSGGFGRVYLARDDELERLVAIKVPHLGAFPGARQVEEFVREARAVAALHHPGIVTVFDIGRQDNGTPFVVMEYVPGRSLAELFEAGGLPPSRLAKLMAEVADAVHHAHKQGLVHRDLKPANILIGPDGEPRVADFGLAIRGDRPGLQDGEVAGTPAFMAPEQVRGETHRFDGRTDIWGLGVILYFGLTGRVPFSGRNRAEIFQDVLNREATPPRQVAEGIPRELERIVLKCLAKRMTDRYQAASDLADDLRTWLASGASASTYASNGAAAAHGLATGGARVVPRGLRSFGVEDADFFLALLPGPRDRDGLPESVRSWKARIEARDGESAFSVGMIYGPSGCGKSSLVKAGLLPRLDRRIRPIYVEATPGGTEARLRSALRREFPALAADVRLADAVAAIREGQAGSGGKLLIVLDQFEQWLHAHPDEPNAELVRALRQCDGGTVQALILVRDDFWMAITRFMRAVEVPIVEGVNSSAVELFDARHARNVLVEFGRVCGRLPDGPAATEGESGRFLDRAVAELAGPDERVVPVRLSLFAEMVRHRPWTPATLRDLGGIEGIGVTFLEETFAAAGAPPAHRLHRQAAEAVLKALLPDPSSVLKGNRRTSRELRQASGYADRPGEFAELMNILDNELRMVTPVDADGSESGEFGAAPNSSGPSYQLTHDYLVRPLRQWLTRKQRETRRGRAEIRLATITALWRDRPETRRLPSPLEWFGILWDTSHRAWSADERRMMTAATRHYLVRAGAALVLLAVLAAGGLFLRERMRANELYRRALQADYAHLDAMLPELAPYRSAIRDRLEALEASPKAPARDRAIAGLLLYRDEPTATRAGRLRERALAAEPEELSLIRDALATHPDRAGLETLRRELADEDARDPARLRAACLLAGLDPGFADLGESATAVASALLGEDRHNLPRWVELLGPSARSIVAPLGREFRDPSKDPTTRSMAAEAMAEALGRLGDGPGLAERVVEAPPEGFRVLVRELARDDRRAGAVEVLERVLTERAGKPDDEAAKDEVARRQANAAVALAMLGRPVPLWEGLKHREDARLRGLLIDRMAVLGLEPGLLLAHLRESVPEPSERQAVLMALAEMADRDELPRPVRSALSSRALDLYRDDPDPGVHSAAELLLRRLGRRDLLEEARRGLGRGYDPASPRRWYVEVNGQTFAVLPERLEFAMGSPASEEGHYDFESRHYRRIDRHLAVSTTEVSSSQIHECIADQVYDPNFSPDPDGPASSVSFFEAARYCNWLSEKAGIARDQWCYPEPVGAGMRIDAKSVDRTGYRLPTEAEWEALCRAGTVTSRPFGQSEELLPRYACNWLNSRERTFPVGKLLPNEYGLFDVLGNVWEWCHDGFLPEGWPPYPASTRNDPAGDPQRDRVVDAETSIGLARGSAFDYSPSLTRSARRYDQRVGVKNPYLGFRVVRTLPRVAGGSH